LSRRSGHHLAELNVRRLVAATVGLRTAGVMAALDRVEGLVAWMPGSGQKTESADRITAIQTGRIPAMATE
jgi:hypothetical protein